MKKIFFIFCVVLGFFVNVVYAKSHGSVVRHLKNMGYITYFNKKAPDAVKNYCSSQGRILYVFDLEKACKINGGRYMLFHKKASVKKTLSYLKGRQKWERVKIKLSLGAFFIFIVGGSFIFPLIRKFKK